MLKLDILVVAEQLKNILSIFLTLSRFHLDISGTEDNEIQL